MRTACPLWVARSVESGLQGKAVSADRVSDPRTLCTLGPNNNLFWIVIFVQVLLKFFVGWRQ